MSNKTEGEVGVLLLKGHMADMPQEDRDKINAAATEFRRLLEASGDAGKIAFALVGCELAAEEGD